ncbi:MAG TPA: hypothetical protein PLT47_10785 [Bacteroidales bacterium]|nr:hypothetical protein [Bacteroidales bacterium]
MNQRRRNKIDEIVNYLDKKALQKTSLAKVIAENITFFKTTYSLFSFYKWLYTKAPAIKAEDIQELVDIDPDSPYFRELISSFTTTEKKFIPGLINPLVKKIIQLIRDKNYRVIISLGAGAMEVEKQVIKKLIRSGNQNPIIFIGNDTSDISHSLARENLTGVTPEVAIIEKKLLNEAMLKGIIKETTSTYTIVLCNNDIFSLDKYFTGTNFDLAYTSFFKHHFMHEQATHIDQMLSRHSKEVIDYDGVKNKFNIFIQPLFVWKNPVLLNGTVFSNLRYKTKRDLKTHLEDVKITTYRMQGTYLKETTTPVIMGNRTL